MNVSTYQLASSKHIPATNPNSVCTVPNTSDAQFPAEKGSFFNFVERSPQNGPQYQRCKTPTDRMQQVMGFAPAGTICLRLQLPEQKCPLQRECCTSLH